WFLENMREIVAFERPIADSALTDGEVLRRAKQLGFADRRIAELTGASEGAVRTRRLEHGIRATFKTVDTCAAEFVAHTPYLYFEPLTLEDVLNIVERERPLGVVVQFGGQTPLKLAVPLRDAGVPILGTSPDAIDRAEDRKRFSALLTELGLQQAAGATARSLAEAQTIATQIGYPVLVRPSYVLGGRAMRIVYDEQDLGEFMHEAVQVSPEHPILIDKFLDDAIEIVVDAVADGTRV